METSDVRAYCPHCNNVVEITRSWEQGGYNDSGGYVLECGNSKCKSKFAVHIGKDINASHVKSGARKIDQYDDGIEGDKERVLREHGLQT